MILQTIGSPGGIGKYRDKDITWQPKRKQLTAIDQEQTAEIEPMGTSPMDASPACNEDPCRSSIVVRPNNRSDEGYCLGG